MSILGGGVSAGTIYANLKLNSTLDKDVKVANKSLGSLKTAFAGVGVVGVTTAAAIAGKFIKMAAAEEAVSRRTASLLKAQGVMWNDVNKSLDGYLKGIERLTAYNDTDLQEAFNTLLVSGISYSEAMETMNTVTSMSYSLNRDLVSMAMLVGKAYNGQTGELSRYGIVLDQNLDKSQKFSALQNYVNTNFADASERTGTLSGQLEVLKNSTFNIAESMGSEFLPDFVSGLEELNAWGDAGGWATTADVLKDIAESLKAIGYSAAMVTDTIGMAYHGTTGIFDMLGEKYYNLFDESSLSDEDKALRDWYSQQADYHAGKVNEEGYELRDHFRKSGQYGASALWDYEPYTPPERQYSVTGTGQGPGIPTPTVAGFGNAETSGSIPAWAGHGKQLQAYYGTPSGARNSTGVLSEESLSSLTVYNGTSSTASPSGQGQSSVSVLSSIQAGIHEGNKKADETNRLLKDNINAIKNIKLTSRMSGGFGSSGSSNSSPTSDTITEQIRLMKWVNNTRIKNTED